MSADLPESTDTETGSPDMLAENGGVLTLADYAERAYLDYAVSVVKGRALPDVRDGLKPVQRRILYAMRTMGLAAAAKPVKSARVVGEVLGRFHPHGDQSAYDAMVRMAQEFSLRYPLVDGQGNFGSRDGDGAAAMRYTEARLTALSGLLLDELEEGTVTLIPNYDGSTEEPELLPARLPMVLLNGASGIAVGLATEIPSHNLREVAAAAVALIKKPETSLDEVLALLPGPDYPGGAQIINRPGDIREAYASGRGSFKVRATGVFEELARGQWQWVVTELPHGVSSQQVLEDIEELTNPKVKAGKKTLTPEQQQSKTAMLALLDSVRDESGKDAAVRLVFSPRTRTLERDVFVQALLAQTRLESNVPMNLVAIGLDGRPRCKPLLEILQEWIQYRFERVTLRTEYRLERVNDRLHVLEGRRIVLLNIDEVIAIIRESDDPKVALIARFHLSDRQAEDILEIRLRQLARLEAIKIEQEISKLEKERETLQDLLENPGSMRRLIIREIESDAKAHGDDRRTLIQEARASNMDVPVVDEPVTVIVSSTGWVRSRQGHAVTAETLTWRAGDGLAALIPCRSVDTLVALADTGRAYSVPVASLPGGRGDGVSITTFIELETGSKLIAWVAGPAEQRLVLATKQGYGLAAKLGDLTSRQRSGKQFLTLEEGDQPLTCLPVAAEASHLAVLTDQAGLLVFGLEELRVLASGGRGVMLAACGEGETLAAVQAVGPEGLNLQGLGRGGKVHQLPLSMVRLAPWINRRGRKAKPLEPKLKQWSFEGI